MRESGDPVQVLTHPLDTLPSQKPDIYTFHANLLGISQRTIPFFDIRKFLESVISQALVEPQRVPVPLSFKGVPQVSDSVVSFDVVGCRWDK